MIVSDIKTRAKRLFGDEASVQLTDADIVRAINDAQLDIIKKNENLLEKTATADSQSGIQEYSLPTDLLIFKFMLYKGSGATSYTKLKGMSVAEFNMYVDGWDSDTSNLGVPAVFTLHAGKFLVYPIPQDSITAAFKIYYNRKPVDVVNDSDTPDLPPLYHPILVDLVLKFAYEMDEDWEAAGNKSQETNKDIDYLRGREDWKQEELYPFILTRPEDQW